MYLYWTLIISELHEISIEYILCMLISKTTMYCMTMYSIYFDMKGMRLKRVYNGKNEHCFKRMIEFNWMKEFYLT